MSQQKKLTLHQGPPPKKMNISTQESLLSFKTSPFVLFLQTPLKLRVFLPKRRSPRGGINPVEKY